MAIQIGAKPDSGFDDPLGMLQDCHRRIERFLQILWVVADGAAGRALTREETTAVHSALQYFQTGGQRHTADEEESLFPRLRGGPFEEMARLLSDHRSAIDLHQTVEVLYQGWIASGGMSAQGAERLQSATTHLKHLYEEHIQIEEGVIFPRAAQALDSDSITAIGQEFRARRA